MFFMCERNFFMRKKKSIFKRIIIFLLLAITILGTSYYFYNTYQSIDLTTEYNTSKLNTVITKATTGNTETNNNIVDTLENISRCVVGISKIETHSNSIFSFGEFFAAKQYQTGACSAPTNHETDSLGTFLYSSQLFCHLLKISQFLIITKKISSSLLFLVQIVISECSQNNNFCIRKKFKQKKKLIFLQFVNYSNSLILETPFKTFSYKYSANYSFSLQEL